MASSSTVPPGRRQRMNALEELPVGESVSISRRVALDFGINEGEHRKMISNMRGAIDSQVNRARRKYAGRRYTVENVTAITAGGAALILTVCATRVE